MTSTDAAGAPAPDPGGDGARPTVGGGGTARQAASPDEDGPVIHDDASSGGAELSLDEVDLRITALDLGDEAVFITAPDGTIVEVNDAFVRVTGYSRDEAVGSTPRILSSGLQDEAFYEELWGTITDGQVWQGQLVDRRRDGALRTVHATISPVVDGHGAIRCYVALERDMTGELGPAPHGKTSGLVHTDLHGRGTYADGVAAAMMERRPSELLGNGLLYAMTEEDADAFQELIGRAVETANEHRSEIRTTAGRWLRVTVSPLTVSSGEILGATCVVEDVDEQIGAQRTVERQKALVDSVLNAFDEPVVVAGPDGRVVAKNRAWGEGDDTIPEPVRSASLGSDLVELARVAGEHDGDVGAVGTRLANDLQRTFAGVLTPPRRDRGFRVTPLAWEDGGAVVRWLG